MKQFLYIALPIITSILLGTMFMDISKDKEAIPVIGDANTAKFFQTGSYESLEEAEKMASSQKGIVILEEGKYNIYAAILKNNSNVVRMMAIIEEKNIPYTIKEKYPDQAFYDVLNKYEDLMLNSTSTVAFLQLNKKILERYEILYEN